MSLEPVASWPYPPAPWQLQGSAVGSVFIVSVGSLPSALFAHLPPGARLLGLGGYTLAVVGALHYGPGSDLEYEELLVACPVRLNGRLHVTVGQIWVSSVPAAAGGRELWAVPKRLGAFTRRTAPGYVITDLGSGSLHVSLLARVGRVGPPALRVPLTLAQFLDQRVGLSRCQIQGRPRRARVRWSFGSPGPLAWLEGRRPLLSLGLTRLRVVFGLPTD